MSETSNSSDLIEILSSLRRTERVDISQTVPLPDAQVAFNTASRLFIVLAGLKPITSAIDGRIGQRFYRPGHCLFSVPNGWTIEDWTEPHEMVAVVFRREYTRFVHIRNQGGSAVQTGVKIEHHTSRPIADAGLHIVRALGAASGSGAAPHLVDALISLTLEELQCPVRGDQGKAARSWQLAREYLAEHFHQDLSRSIVARELGLTPAYLSRLCSQQGGRSFLSEVRHLRIERALQLLTGTPLSVKEVAAACGFRDVGRFIRVFGAEIGTSPGRYRNRQGYSP